MHGGKRLQKALDAVIANIDDFLDKDIDIAPSELFALLSKSQPAGSCGTCRTLWKAHMYYRKDFFTMKYGWKDNRELGEGTASGASEGGTESDDSEESDCLRGEIRSRDVG